MSCFFTRLQQRDRWPRRWWYPPDPPGGSFDNERWNSRHAECSKTVQRAMLALMAVSFYCLLTAFGTPDTALLVPDSAQSLPMVGARVTFGGILVAAPAVLLAITFYLHVFLGQLQYLDHPIWHFTGFHSRIPTLFNLEQRELRWLSYFIFYWLTPLSMAALAWKAMGRPEWSIPALWSVALTVVWLLWLQIRRCAAERRKWFSPPAFLAIGLLLAGAPYGTGDAFLHPGDSLVQRRLYLYRTQLKDAWLPDAKLAGANLSLAILAGAELQYAKLAGANLEDAKLAGANLSLAILEGANLHLANLEGADLFAANLKGADLEFANLEGADLIRANLAGAVLRDANLAGAKLLSARNLNCDQLRQARNWEQAFRDDVLACAAQIPDPLR